MKKVFLFLLIFFSLILLIIRFTPKFTEDFLGLKPKSGISIMSTPSEAKVFLDQVEVGKTPYENKQLEPKEYLVKVEKDAVSWQGKIKLTSGTLTVINRELANNSSSSAGETLMLEKGRGVTVVSNPSEAEIEIDGKSFGKTPVTINIDYGDHMILINHGNYLKRSIKANIPIGYSLTISADLALSEADLTSVSSPITTQTQEVEVTDTPTGFLRVREKPTVSSKEIARVKPKDRLVLLEELAAWDRVRLPDKQEGYISSAYTKKIQP